MMKLKFDVNEFLKSGVEGDDVEFAFVAPLRPLADLNIPAHEVALQLVPLSDQFLKMISWHSAPAFCC
jgi:hypothetical protein